MDSHLCESIQDMPFLWQIKRFYFYFGKQLSDQWIFTQNIHFILCSEG